VFSFEHRRSKFSKPQRAPNPFKPPRAGNFLQVTQKKRDKKYQKVAYLQVPLAKIEIGDKSSLPQGLRVARILLDLRSLNGIL
jgi:hypothetical protein